jgi:hypothetical protein
VKVYRARSVLLLPLLFACVTFAAAGFVLSVGNSAKGSVTPSWIIGQNAISLMEQAGEPGSTIGNTFANQSTFVYGDTAQNHIAPSTFGVPTMAFGSYQDIVSAFSSGVLPGKFKAVIYDNERWAYTPLSEQQDPAYYEQQTAQLLHAYGLLYIATPAPDLMWALGRPPDSYQAFLGANMAASAARYADIYDIQGQQREDNLPYFSWFVAKAAAQARAANPHVEIFVGIRTDPGTQNLLAAYQATAGIADGYWLNVNGIPGPANDLLNAIRQPWPQLSSSTSPPLTSYSTSSSPAWTQSPSANSAPSPISGSLAPSDINGSYLTSGIHVVGVTPSAGRSNWVVSRSGHPTDVINFGPGVAVALALPVLATLYGLQRCIRRLARCRKDV